MKRGNEADALNGGQVKTGRASLGDRSRTPTLSRPFINLRSIVHRCDANKPHGDGFTGMALNSLRRLL